MKYARRKEGREREEFNKNRDSMKHDAVLDALRACHANDIRLQGHSEAFNPACGIYNERGQRIAMPAGVCSCRLAWTLAFIGRWGSWDDAREGHEMPKRIPVLENSSLDALQVCARVIAWGFISKVDQKRRVLGLGRSHTRKRGEGAIKAARQGTRGQCKDSKEIRRPRESPPAARQRGPTAEAC